MENILHIYAQESWHNDSYIVGTRDSLELLRTAIDRALALGVAKTPDVFVTDGEGYNVLIAMVEEDDKRINYLEVPYINIEAKQHATSLVFSPYQLFIDHHGRSILEDSNGDETVRDQR